MKGKSHRMVEERSGRRGDAAAVTSCTRARRPGHHTGFTLRCFNVKPSPDTHCDAGDVLLALVARHLHRCFVVRCALNRYRRNVMCGLLAAERLAMVKQTPGMVAADPREAGNVRRQTLSQLRVESWQPPDLHRCTKPFLPRRSQTRGEGGTTLEPLPHKRTLTSMRRASPCSIDRREPLMPSIALLGLVEAVSTRRNTQQPSYLCSLFTERCHNGGFQLKGALFLSQSLLCVI